MTVTSENHSNGTSEKSNGRVESKTCVVNDVPESAAITDSSQELLYKVDDVPPWYLCILLGFQQYLTMFSSTMSIPYILAPAFCIGEDNPARAHLISTILFVSGIATLLQTNFGIRLPIVQGGTFAFFIPTFGILSLPQWRCPQLNGTAIAVGEELAWQERDNDEIWKSRLREVQGCIAVASLFEVLIGLSGGIGAVLRFITPLAIAPTITLVGLSLFESAANLASGNWAIAASTIALLLLFSQYITHVGVPLPVYNFSKKQFSTRKVNVFSLLPVLLTVVIMWSVCAVLTTAGILDETNSARTDQKARILNDSPWFRVPYPGQWGLPTVSVAGVFGMLAGVLASCIESVGDYYACSRLSGAPPPPPTAINRGLMTEGVGCVIAGIFGSGNGTTSYSENIGAIGITKVASRRVVQCAAVLMILFATCTKFGALFASMPTPVVGGVFMVTFGMITAVGISNVQYVNMNSPRNMIILGFSIFTGLALPKWMAKNMDVIQTGSPVMDQIIGVLLSTGMLVGGVLGFILDNTIPGSEEERGLNKWRAVSSTDPNSDLQSGSSNCYDLPFGLMTIIRRYDSVFRWLPISPTFNPPEFSFQDLGPVSYVRGFLRRRKPSPSSYQVSDMNGHRTNGQVNEAFERGN